METRNDFMVTVRGGKVAVCAMPMDMDKETALRFAAWIVLVADALPPVGCAEEEFHRVLEAIQNV